MVYAVLNMKKRLKKTKGQRSWDLAQELGKYCDDTGAPDPGRFLAELMAGQDPRPGQTSRLYQLVKRGRNEETPEPEDWAEIVEIVTSDDRFMRDFVPADVSFQAATKLMDFLYAKRKAVEISGHLSASVAVTEPLTVEEIERFEETFFSEF